MGRTFSRVIVQDIEDVLGTPAGADVSTDIATIDSYHDVPTKDATTDTVMRDVLGKKDDTAVTTVGTTKTVIAYAKGILNTTKALANWLGYGSGNTQLEIGAFAAAAADNSVAVVSGGANTLGSWTQLVASLGADSYLANIYLCVADIRVNGAKIFAVEIGTGAGMSEVTKVRIPFHMYHDVDGFAYSESIGISPPIKIASGTRIAARTTHNTGVAAIQVNLGWQIDL